jgi:hypothetical protein
MLNFEGTRFPIDVILVCIRWYAAYPLSYRHLEEIMVERGVSVDHSGRFGIRHVGLSSRFDTTCCGQNSRILLNATHPFVWISVRSHGLVEEALPRGHVALGRQQEVDGLALLVDGAVEIFQTPLTLM